MVKQIDHISRSVYLEIRRISSIRHLLTTKATAQLMCSFVLSQLDDCRNSLLIGINCEQMYRLKKVQNHAVVVVVAFYCCKSRHEHVRPMFKTLHWLPVKDRIIFKITAFVFRFVCMCVCACVRVCVRACVCVLVFVFVFLMVPCHHAWHRVSLYTLLLVSLYTLLLVSLYTLLLLSLYTLLLVSLCIHSFSCLSVYSPSRVSVYTPSRVSVYTPSLVSVYTPSRVSVYSPSRVSVYTPSRTHFFTPGARASCLCAFYDAALLPQSY